MSNTTKGLMTKKKAELIDIILRKDDEEARLRKANEAAKKDAEEKDKTIKRLNDSLTEANRNVEQHQAGMDEITSQKVALKESLEYFKKQYNTARNWNLVLGTSIVIIAALWILL